jgi:hypothetical protein
MKVLIIDIDSRIPNLALKKIEKYHQDRGDEVIWNMPIAKDVVDKIYVSCVFTKNKHRCHIWEGYADIGGSGYSLEITLPSEIDVIKPRINYGFTTRGCIRNCKFCIVPRKEGKIHIVGDLLDLWDGKSQRVTVMDNNILGLPSHFGLICKQARENKIKLDFNQGLDHRLLTLEIVHLMTKISHTEYRFAFDHPSMFKSVEKAIDLLQANGINRANWYVLVGFDTTYKQDLDRANYLKDRNQRAYIMRYETHYRDPFYVALARWVNQPHLFVGMTWQEFLNYPRPDHRRLRDAIMQDEEYCEIKTKELELVTSAQIAPKGDQSQMNLGM